MRLFISQPMRDKTNEEIESERWEKYRRCQMEHDACYNYGIPYYSD